MPRTKKENNEFYCKYCNHLVENDDLFCENCGHALDEESKVLKSVKIEEKVVPKRKHNYTFLYILFPIFHPSILGFQKIIRLSLA